MTDKQERAANEITGLLTAVVVYPGLARRPEIRSPLLALADKGLKGTDGQVQNDLEIARANLKAL
jgi:hypothetical protein